MSISKKTIIVTGGASGIGRATVELLASEGAAVIVGDIDTKGGAELSAWAQVQNVDVEYVPLDLTKAESIKAFADQVTALPSVYGLVNAAGWDQVEPFMENTRETWERLIAINLLGPITLTHSILPKMIAAKEGKIVNVSSDAGRVGSMGETVYSATKGGIISFTKSLARELARYKINVNCVAPGPTDTPLLRNQTNPFAARVVEGLAAAIPFRRLAEPKEIAEGINFFLSPKSAFVTGQVLSVNGGLTMMG
jgi:2-hydroxycyclohexanecarboxyl-CoA dehydrogenase